MDGSSGRSRHCSRAMVASVAVLFVATIGYASASASASPSPANGVHQRIRMTEPYDQQTEVDLDFGAPGISQGDISEFTGELYSANGAVHLGFENSQCTVGLIDDQTFQFVCSSYFVLRGGQITMQGTLVFPLAGGRRAMRAPRISNALDLQFAITGGTGRYESVGGQMDWGGNDPDALILLFDLTR
jgi:hypothetical protein